MTIGDQYRAITPHDQLIFDSTGAVVGIRSGQSSGAELRPSLLTASQVAAFQSLAPGARNPDTFVSDGASLAAGFVGGATAWTRLAGPEQFRQSPWSYSAELTTPSNAALYVTAAAGSTGPGMFRREGASILVDGRVLLGNTGAPTYCNLRTFASGMAAAALQSKSIAILVYCHRLASNGIIKLRVGTDGSNYVRYQWAVSSNTLNEGWNVLVCHTSEPIGASAAANGSRDFQTSGSDTTSWAAAAGTYTFASAPAYIAIEPNNMDINTRIWVEGLYYGGRDVPTLTLGFDIQGSGLSVAKTIMDSYGLGAAGYAAVPMGNAVPANPQFNWSAADITRLQGLYNAGWDIVQHSVSHNSMGTLTDDSTLLAEMEACRENIALMGCGTGGQLFPTPNSSWSNRLVSLAGRAGVRWMRHGSGAPMFIPKGLVGLCNPLIEGSFGMSSTYVLSNANAIARILAFVDLLITYGCSGHVFTHAVLAAGNASTSLDLSADVFEPVCAGLAARVAAGTLRVITPSQYVRESGPPRLAYLLANPSRLPITPGASPYDLINVGYAPLRFQISGGTVSAITYSRDGSTFDSVGAVAGQFDLNPGDRLRITYTVAPTITQYSI